MVFVTSLCTCFNYCCLFIFKKNWKILFLKNIGKLCILIQRILLSHEEEQTTDTKRGRIPEIFRRIPFVWRYRKGKTNPGGPKVSQRLPGTMKVGDARGHEGRRRYGDLLGRWKCSVSLLWWLHWYVVIKNSSGAQIGCIFWHINDTSKKVDLKRKEGLEKAMIGVSLCNLKNKSYVWASFEAPEARPLVFTFLELFLFSQLLVNVMWWLSISSPILLVSWFEQ